VDPQPGDELVVTRRRRVVEVDPPGCVGRRRVRYVCPTTGVEGEVLLSSWRRWAETAQVLA
jgi:hypothetical protein